MLLTISVNQFAGRHKSYHKMGLRVNATGEFDFTTRRFILMA
jgi:hypothetical protein